MMGNRIKKILVIMAAFAMITLFHKAGEVGSVFWSIFAHSTKDVFIVGLLLVTVNKKDNFDISSTVLSLFYFVALFSVRIYCAISSGLDYKIYMELMKSIDLSNLLVLIIVILAVVVLIPLKDERSSRIN